MQLSTVEKSITGAAAVVRGVVPEQFAAPTPCAGWEVRTLVNHLLQVVSALRLAGRHEPVPGGLWERDLMADDWAGRFDAEGRDAVAAWTPPEAWDGAVSVNGMSMPARMAAAMFAGDLVLHGWDLARATGQRYHGDEETSAAAYELLVRMGDQGRQMGIFAAPHAVADDAPTLVRAVALSGRDPDWSRPAA